MTDEQRVVLMVELRLAGADPEWAQWFAYAHRTDANARYVLDLIARDPTCTYCQPGRNNRRVREWLEKGQGVVTDY